MDSSQATSALTTEESVGYSAIIEQVFTCTNKHLHVLIDRMISNADKKLFDKAEKAKSDEERMRYMDCTRIFRTERNDISLHFFNNLNKSLAFSDSSVATEDEELSLVHNDEMEEMVAITTMYAKAMNVYGEQVNHLEARLEYMELMCQKIFDKESLDPKHICEVFQATIEDLDIGIESKLIFYKLFDEEVCSKLEVMYRAVNKIFIDNNIMPEILLKTTKTADVEYIEEEVSSQVASYYDPAKNAARGFIPRANDDVSRIVNEFMSGDMTISGDEIELPASFLRVPTQQDLEGKNCYDRKEVIKALSHLQHKISSLKNNDDVLTTEQIKQEVLNDIGSQNGGVVDKQVNILDERSIDFVGMMFTAITEDTAVSKIMTSLIYQLQIPVIKVAMSDNNLFEKENHPARVTVDLLSQAGKGVNQQEDHLYHELEMIVDHVLDEFEINVEAFEKAVDELEILIQTEEQLANDTELQQQKQVLQEHARNIVITQLKMVSCEKQIPDKVRPLILKHWSTLMLNRYIRHGRSSQQWVQSVLLLKLLLKCLQPIHFQSQLKMIENNHLALLEALNDELFQTQQNQHDISDQITQLRAYFLDLIDSNKLKIVDDDDKALTDEELIDEAGENTEKELDLIKQQTELAKQKISQLTSATKPGAWYEIFNGEDRAVRRLKLSVILTDAAQLIFVDRKGIKVMEKDADVFAKELEENKSRILADHSTFNHALGQVMGALAA